MAHLAQIAGCDISMVSLTERRLRRPSAKLAAALARVLGVDASDLFGQDRLARLDDPTGGQAT
jgi:transcriptional regulator with XRE-family HTH domain